jgi:hypothetical protein
VTRTTRPRSHTADELGAHDAEWEQRDSCAQIPCLDVTKTVIQARAEVREPSLDRYNLCVLGQDLVEVEGEHAVLAATIASAIASSTRQNFGTDRTPADPTTPHVDHRVKRGSSSGLVTSVFRQKYGGAEQE